MIDIISKNTKQKGQKIHDAVYDPALSLLYEGNCSHFIRQLPQEPILDLVITSPPYNIGKAYEIGKTMPLEKYIAWQEGIIRSIYPLLKENGSICWQVGNYVEHGSIIPLDIVFAGIFNKFDLQLRNRVIWTYGHGLHSKKRFSGRYEVVMWYTKSDDYVFNLDPVRVKAKYPGKRAYKGPNKGQLSGNRKGKNPTDVWDIPNVKGNHIEKTAHPCQFPVALIERLVLALTNEGGLVFDPFCGVASSGVAALLHGRRYMGCDTVKDYLMIGKQRLEDTETGTVAHRPLDKPLYDPRDSNLSKTPEEWLEQEDLP